MKIGITQGDINGIGYEVILKALTDSHILEVCTPVIYGSAKAASIMPDTMKVLAVVIFIRFNFDGKYTKKRSHTASTCSSSAISERCFRKKLHVSKKAVIFAPANEV